MHFCTEGRKEKVKRVNQNCKDRCNYIVAYKPPSPANPSKVRLRNKVR